MTEAITSLLLLAGGGFMLLAAIGVWRMPDLYMRMGTSTKATTLGLACILTAVAVYSAEASIVARALATIVFVFLTTPVAAHVLGRAAYKVGVPLWEATIIDELRGAYGDERPQTTPDAPGAPRPSEREDQDPATAEG
mgnify:CR=1 FL=1